MILKYLQSVCLFVILLCHSSSATGVAQKLNFTKCKQSSTVAPCKLAMNGDSKVCSESDLSKTGYEKQASWTGLFPTKVSLEYVRILARRDTSKSGKLKNFKILTDGDKVCAEYNKTNSFIEKIFECKTLTRTVKIQLMDKTFLELCEVEPYGKTRIDGGWNKWAKWETCTKKCGTETILRRRVCNSPTPQSGGSGCIGRDVQVKDCHLKKCAGNVDGAWSKWSPWTRCTKPCNTGTATRSRKCDNPKPSGNGAACIGKTKEHMNCHKESCPVNGKWAEWSDWSSCPKTCGVASKTRKRYCTNPTPAYGGQYCKGCDEETSPCGQRACPVDGKWSAWKAWSVCTKNCGNGTRARDRFCDNPSPNDAGRPCQGSSSFTEACNEHPCPIDGSWSAWASWTACTRTCGIGLQKRKRECASPSPQFGGKQCHGNALDSKKCHKKECPQDGRWGQWDSWTNCTAQCGSGRRIRIRLCDSPIPMYAGLDCLGSAIGNETCNPHPCPIDGKWSVWSAWTLCSRDCGVKGGIKTRIRACDSPFEQYGGKKCTGKRKEEAVCNKKPCPINGQWSKWKPFGVCNKKCGSGNKTRARTCDNPKPQYGGENCVGKLSESVSCNVHPCSINGKFSAWTTWTDCTVTCGGGTKDRRRNCDSPAPSHGGKKCVGKRKQRGKCNEKPCPVNGKWSKWSDWTKCKDLIKLTGSRSRTRTCNKPEPKFGGEKCAGLPKQTMKCKDAKLTINGVWSAWQGWSKCPVTCGKGDVFRHRSCDKPSPLNGGKKCPGSNKEKKICKNKPCPINGQFSKWTTWAKCSVACGTGTQERKRACSNPAPKYGGLKCKGELKQKKECSMHPCPIDGKYSEFSAWTKCTKTCGNGTHTRSRSCDNPKPEHGGKNCSGPSSVTEPCNQKPCPINGKWSKWSVFGVCSKKCGGGAKVRTRKCDSPKPQYGGLKCIGKDKQSEECNTHKCPVNGGWSKWTAYNDCSKTCGTGEKSRSRGCGNPAPKYGGKNCIGSPKETKKCNTKPCPRDGLWSNWKLWSACTKSCGDGTRTRQRKCDKPTPKYGGKTCTGNASTTENCFLKPCPINGEWGKWLPWESCSLPCGGGNQSKSRECNNPAPQYNGTVCPGNGTQFRVCNTQTCKVNGGWGFWSSWTECTLQCGKENTTRVRRCDHPAPSNGGLYCKGSKLQAKSCPISHCPVDGNWSPWSPWSQCTKKCNVGNQIRIRKCTNPAPKYGGKQCDGLFREDQTCHERYCKQTYVIQRRVNGNVSFDRTWKEYENGFGDISGDYWRGLKALYKLTGRRNRKMIAYFEFRTFEQKKTDPPYIARYEDFSVGSPADDYRLSVSGFSTPTPDFLLDSVMAGQSNGAVFTTKDKNTKKCTKDAGNPGWWFTEFCEHDGTSDIQLNPNGVFSKTPRKGNDVIRWHQGFSNAALKSFTIYLETKPQKKT